jgi:hypothetical protein
MSPAVKTTGTAAMLAAAIVITLSWGLGFDKIVVPETVIQSWQAALTFGLGYLLHSKGIGE